MIKEIWLHFSNESPFVPKIWSKSSRGLAKWTTFLDKEFMNAETRVMAAMENLPGMPKALCLIPTEKERKERKRWGRQTKGRILITFAFLRRQSVDNTGVFIFSSVLWFVSERLRSKRTWLLEGRLISKLFQSLPLHFLQKKGSYIPDRHHVSSDWPFNVASQLYYNFWTSENPNV